jgi:D-alanyl-D-alanine carboxypeptidase
MKKDQLVSTVLLLALFLSACSQSSNTTLPYSNELQAVLDITRESAGLRGVSVAIILPGYEPWLGVSGESYAGQPITEEMLFDMGSAGKILVGPLIVKLAEDGLISLDDPISKHLPDFPYADGTITIRQLLNHTSGLYMMTESPDGPFRKPFAQIDHEKWWTIDEIFTTLGGEPYHAPGEGYCYTQAGYQIATLIVEKVTGSTVAEQIQTRLLDPLDIDGMYIDFPKPVSGNREIAHPWFDLDYDREYEDIHDYSRNWIVSLSRIYYYASAKDFALWGDALFTGKVLNEDSMNLMLDFYRTDDWCGDEAFQVGYGMGVQDFNPALTRGQTAWGHLGSIQGYRTILTHLPQYDMTLVVMTNTDSDNGFAVVDGLLDVLLSHLDTAEDAMMRPVDVEPVKAPPADVNVVETFQKENLFCEHNPEWTVQAGTNDWVNISLEWVIGTDAMIAENVWKYHKHTITINGQEIENIESYTHDVEHYSVACPSETLEIWAKGLSIYLPPLPPGMYEIRWFSEITVEFNNGWTDYKPGNFMEITATLTVE